MSQVKKILIIGSSAYKKSDSEVRIDSYSWRKIGRIKNPRDYHTLIIDLLSISDGELRSQVPWSDVQSKLNIYTCTQIIKRGGEIIFIGNSRFHIPASKKSDKRHSNKNIPFLEWTGLEFNWDNSPSDTTYTVDNDRKYEQYLKKLSQCDYSLTSVSINDVIMEQGINLRHLKQEGITVDVKTNGLSQNLSRYALAFTVFLEYYRDEYHAGITRKKLFYTGGPIIFLPRIDAPEDETLEIVLRDICGVTISLPEPQWIHEYIAPGQDAVDKDIGDYKARIEKAKFRLEKAEKKCTEVRRPLKLLYGTGIDLRQVVWEVLEALEAKVEKPENPNEEDGCISVEIGNQVERAVIEVKSTRSSQFDKSGIRQLGEWIAKKTVEDNKQYKGIFIGNDSFDKPIEEREQPFSPDFEKSATILKLCSLRTEDLYKIYWLKSSKKLDISAFWSDVFQTDGVFRIDKYFSGTIPKKCYSS